MRTAIAQLERAGECQKAIAGLKAANATDDADWYAWLVELHLDCLAKTEQPAYGSDALSLVNAGIARFPQSSRLVFLKGFVYSRLMEGALAQRYYADAAVLAAANIAADRTHGPKSADDRVILRAAEQT